MMELNNISKNKQVSYYNLCCRLKQRNLKALLTFSVLLILKVIKKDVLSDNFDLKKKKKFK